MKKFKLLAVFLATAVIGLASMSVSSVSTVKEVVTGEGKNAIYVANGSSYTKYRSSESTVDGINKDIRSIKSEVAGKTIYVRDSAMYQKLKNLGATDITSGSDPVIKLDKENYGYNIHMVRF